jgi:hypothetical protein
LHNLSFPKKEKDTNMKQIFVILVVAIILLMASCGPSPEEIASMTAAAWTSTPLPTATPTATFTPTPIPYDLTVKVTDQDGNPVIGASVSLPESGDDQPVVADDSGQVTWSNLPGESGTLNASAQGYLPAQQSFSIKRGPNEVILIMQVDPYGLLPSAACVSGETLAYVEDLQDGKANGWPEIEFNAPGWAVGPDPLDANDLVISATNAGMTGDGGFGANLQELVFENAVWRIRYRVEGSLSGNSSFSLNWPFAREPIMVDGTEVFDSRYQFPFTPGGLEMRRLQQPILNISVARGRMPANNEWHYVEIGTFQGYTEVWIDGEQNMTYQDPEPLPPGGPGLEIWLMDDTVTLYFDDISVCELSAPFTSVVTPEPAQ